MINTQIISGNVIYTIVGILQPWPSNFFFQTDFNTAILVPIQTALRTEANANISNLAIRIHSTAGMDMTEMQITQYLQNLTQSQVVVQSPKSLIDSMQKSSETMTILLGLIGSISLIVGGIGVTNIMLVSVAERHREIGLRLAVGARQRDIQWQFLVESVTLSIFGGISGMLLGIVITLCVSLYSHWQFQLYLLPPMPAINRVGIFFGFYPALLASRLDPIQTLRSE